MKSQESGMKSQEWKVFVLMVLIAVLAAFAVGQTYKTYDTPVKIISRPLPKFPKGQDCSQGTIILRIEFLETGEIGKIQLLSGINKSCDEAVIEAAQKIKFNPATKDGKPVTVTKQVQYRFSLF